METCTGISFKQEKKTLLEKELLEAKKVVDRVY